VSISESGEVPTVYAVRLSAQAHEDLDAAMHRLSELSEDPVKAKEWVSGFYAVIATLSTHPRRFPVAELESRRLGRQTRRLLYRRSSTSTAAYHVFYNVVDEGPDGPAVTVMLVRHAAQKPLTRDEARRILANQ
jgi:hypothetical protein